MCLERSKAKLIWTIYNSAGSFCIFRGTEFLSHTVSTKEQKHMQTMYYYVTM